jgi:hypothetical protein
MTLGFRRSTNRRYRLYPSLLGHLSCAKVDPPSSGPKCLIVIITVRYPLQYKRGFELRLQAASGRRKLSAIDCYAQDHKDRERKSLYPIPFGGRYDI